MPTAAYEPLAGCFPSSVVLCAETITKEKLSFGCAFRPGEARALTVAVEMLPHTRSLG